MTIRGMETLTDCAATSMPRRVVGISQTATARSAKVIRTVNSLMARLPARGICAFAVQRGSVTGAWA